MKLIKSLIVMLQFLCISNTWAFVTFFNNSENDTLVVTYQLCPSSVSSVCSSSFSTKSIPPKTVYKDMNIELSDNSQDRNSYFYLFVTSVKVIHPDKSTIIKTIPAKIFPEGSLYTPCYASKDTGVMFTAFDKQSELFCAAGSG